MKDKFLKMAGVKSEKEFYKKYPTEEAFFKANPSALKMMQTGGGLQDQQIFQYPNYDQNMMAYMQKAQEDQENKPMSAITDMFKNGAMALGQAADNNPGKAMDAMNAIGSFMEMGGSGIMMRDNQYDEGGEMALGQIMAMHDKLSSLQKFVNTDSEIEPWVASKITLADDYLNSVSEYMQYNEGNEGPEEEEDTDMNMGEIEQMKMGGIPERYKNRGFTKVGAKRKSDRAGKKWMVLAKKGDKYKIVHGGYVGMKDFSQHGSEKRKDNFWNRMGGKNSAKATDPFSPLYWHKRFGTWANGGEPNNAGFQALPDYVQNKIISNMAEGGEMIRRADGSYSRRGLWDNIRAAAGSGKKPTKEMLQQERKIKGMANGGTNNAGFQALPEYVQNKILSNMAYGGDMYGGQMDMDSMYQMMKGGGSTNSGDAWYQQGGQGEDQVMQAIQMYAQMTQVDPEQILSQLKAMSPQEQQQAIQQIMEAIQQQQSQSPDSMMAYGGININPANKGKFTASANRAGMSVQEFASKVLANKEDYSSTQVKRANFARNAAGWNKQMGGMTQGSELELHPDEIQNLIDQGYGIEYLD